MKMAILILLLFVCFGCFSSLLIIVYEHITNPENFRFRKYICCLQVVFK